MDTGQKTESLITLVNDIARESVVLPEFQRDFVWEIDKTFDLFDSFIRDIFVGSLIYGIPSFEITTRELDMRPRSGKGSRQKLVFRSYQKGEIDVLVKTQGFRLLLDGQQRATSIYRTLNGVDRVMFVVEPDDSLPEEIRELSPAKRTLEHVLREFRGDPLPEMINIDLNHVFRASQGEAPREKDKAELFLQSSKFEHVSSDNVEQSPEFEAYLTYFKNLENLFRQEKLMAFYLLDTDEEKFAMFFERSNSKGIQLNFIDILAAKLYAGFNLRNSCDKFKDENPDLPLNREVLVRSISFVVSEGRETGRAHILSSLTHEHFNKYWLDFTNHYKKAYEYITNNKLLIHPDWIPYENMLIPMVVFLHYLPKKDISQANERQLLILETWYWLAVLSRRYSSAAQTYVLEDAQALQKLAQEDYSLAVSIIKRIKPLIEKWEDLLFIHRKYDALYKGVLNLINFDSKGLRNIENGKIVTWSSNIEDHHIFPKGFLRKTRDTNLVDTDPQSGVNCVLNRTLIPKLTNIKVSDKPPSEYLQELRKKNPNIETALDSHLIPKDVCDGTYDDLYPLFLEDRGKKVAQAIKDRVLDQRDAIVRESQEHASTGEKILG